MTQSASPRHGRFGRVALTVLLPMAVGAAAVVVARQAGGDPTPGAADTVQPAAAPPTVDQAPSTTATVPAPGYSDSDGALPVLGTIPDFALTDQSGQEFGLPRLVGRTWVATFMFTRCGATCPTQTRAMADVQRRLAATAGGGGGGPASDVHLVSITVDPAHDTPDVLRAYATANAAGPTWHFLTGAPEDIGWLGRHGFMLAVDAGQGRPVHSAHLALVDLWGQVRGYYDAMEPGQVEALMGDLARVAVAPGDPPAEPGSEAVARTLSSQVFSGELADETPWLRQRRRDQLAAAAEWQTFHGFRFDDRARDSGITFHGRVTDDSASTYKPVHYDHGTGLAAADVDNDGRTDLYFVNQVGQSQLWRNLGGGKFEDVTAKSGAGVRGPIAVAAAFTDVDNDGDPDLCVTTVRGGNVLRLNDGAGTFTDATAGSGLDLSGHYSTPVFFDYDRDGLLDALLCEVGVYSGDQVRPVTTPPVPGDAHAYTFHDGFKDAFAGHLKPERLGRSVLLRNTGNARFADVTRQVGLDSVAWTGDAVAHDVNADGWPDLYLLNMQGDDEYWENQGGRMFARRTRDYFPKTPWGAMGVASLDANADGRLDLYVTDMHSDMSKFIAPNPEGENRKSDIQFDKAFLATDGTSLFGNALHLAPAAGGMPWTEASDALGVETYWPWGPTVGDFNADGFDDVFVTAGMGYPFRYAPNSLLLNEDGRRFVDAEFVLGVEPRRGFRTALPMFQLDTAGKDKAHHLSAGRAGTVTVWGSLSTRSAVAADIDDDGDLDLVTNEFVGEPMVLVSDLSDCRPVKYLKVRLVGTASNRDGLGAVVRVRADGREQVKANDGKSGYLAQSSLPLYFGLGDTPQVESVTVTWPTGKSQTLPGPIDANRVLTVTEPRE